jgi:hypothetical protein
MPKVKWALSGDTEELEGGSFYDGACPPKGMYVVALKRMGLKVNKSGDDMWNALVEIRETRNAKKKFNGYAFWFNRNLTEAGARFVRNFVEKGLGIPWEKFLKMGAVTESTDKPTNVVSLAGVKIANEPLMTIMAKRRRQNDDPDGEWELVADDFAPAFPGIDPATLSDDEEEYDEDEDDSAAVEDPEDPFAADDEDDSDDEDDDESDDEDEGDEGAPSLEELNEMEVKELRDLAKDPEVDVYAKGMKKADLVAALDAYYRPEDDEEPDDEDEDEDEDEDDDDEEDEPTPPPTRARKAPAKKAARPARR